MRSLVSILLLLSLPVLAAQRPGEALIAAAPSQFAKIDDISVHYKFLGEGGPVTLLVHGGGCDLTFWELQVPALLESGSVLLLDLPGHGKSDTPEDVRYSMKLHARAIDAVMKKAGVSSAVVVGHSLGVPALRQFYRSQPGKVDGFVAIDGILLYEDMGFMISVLDWLLDSWLYDTIWPAIEAGFVTDSTPEWGRDKVVNSMTNAPPFVVKSFYPEMFHPETAINDSISVPVLAIYADAPTWTEEIQADIRAFNDRTRLVMMPDVSHFLMLDNPTETNRLLLEFISEL